MKKKKTKKTKNEKSGREKSQKSERENHFFFMRKNQKIIQRWLSRAIFIFKGKKRKTLHHTRIIPIGFVHLILALKRRKKKCYFQSIKPS